MTKYNEKCATCLHRDKRGVIINSIETKSNNWCSHKSINLNNIIVKSCTHYDNGRPHPEPDDSEEEFTPEQVFKNLPPQQKRINFFR